MPCYHPVQAFQRAPGARISFNIPPGSTDFRAFRVPCGTCIGCRLEYSRQWSVRIMHEASLHDANSFLTLTYDDDHVPHDFSLDHNHIVQFMDRLRADRRYRGLDPVRYYMCGEYGDRTSRPHYHMCMFGEDFSADRKMYSINNGNHLYTSDYLDDKWRLGACQIGSLTVQSASYVARYVVDKQRAQDSYEIVDPESGELFTRRLPYCRMSLRPAVGRRWIEQYSAEVYDNENDSCYADGRMHVRPPRYYDRVVSEQLGKNIDGLKQKRVDRAVTMSDNNTSDRLAVREQVKLAQIRTLRRGDT